MESLSQILPLFIYILLIGLLIISIILGIKLIITMNKVERIVNNIEDKINSLNGIFSIIDATSSRVTVVYQKILDFISSIFEKLFLGKKEREEEDYE